MKAHEGLIAKILMFSLVCFIVSTGLFACSWFKANGAAVASDVGNIAACVIAHAENDPDPTFESIAAECSGAAVADVVAIVTAMTAPTDAGEATIARYKRVHHKVTP